MFTILLRFGDYSLIPQALTLRTGLAVSLAIEDLVPALKDQVQVKWPNDIMIQSRKIAGILAEADGNNVFIGVGINVAQEEFPEEYRSKAGSIIQFFPALPDDARFVLLEKILLRLYEEIEDLSGGKNATASLRETGSWLERLTRRLYKRGEIVTFAEGSSANESVESAGGLSGSGSGAVVEGILLGLGPGGELLIIPKGEKKERAFVTGELRVY